MYAVQGSAEAVLSGLVRLVLLDSPKVCNQVVFVALGAVVLW